MFVNASIGFILGFAGEISPLAVGSMGNGFGANVELAAAFPTVSCESHNADDNNTCAAEVTSRRFGSGELPRAPGRFGDSSAIWALDEFVVV